MALQTVDYNVNDGTGSLDGTITYDDANGNQITRVEWNNTSQTDWVLTIESGNKLPLKTTIRHTGATKSGVITNPATLAGYVGDPLLIGIGSS